MTPIAMKSASIGIAMAKAGNLLIRRKAAKNPKKVLALI